MNSRFVRAKKQAVKGRFLFAGTAGAGRIRAALHLALGLTDGKIAVLDTEYGMAKLQSDVGDFDVLEVSGPYTTDKFIAAVEAAEQEGYEVLVIDSLSPAWAGEGGILEQVGKLTASKGSKNGAWDIVQPQHDEMMSRIQRSNPHVLVILQSKTEYLLPHQPGAVAPKKIGLAPVQRDGIDYGFHASFYVDEPSQIVTCLADYTGLFGSAFAELLTKEHGAKLRTWLENGETPVVKEQPASKPEGAAASANAPTAMFVNAEQVTAIKNLLKETKADTARFLEYFKVEKLENLPASKFDQAFSMLDMKGKGTQAGQPAVKLAEALRARNIPFEECPDGILATPKFSDNAAKQFLREQGFKWEAKKKKWQIAA